MEIIVILIVSLMRAIICALPGFFIGLFYDIQRWKKWIFLVCAVSFSIYLLLLRPDGIGFWGLVSGFIEDFCVIYIGALILVGFRNMAQKFGLCKICDKFRRKRENSNDN